MFSHTSKSNDFGRTLCSCFNDRKYSFSLLSQTLSGYCDGLIEQNANAKFFILLLYHIFGNRQKIILFRL